MAERADQCTIPSRKAGTKAGEYWRYVVVVVEPDACWDWTGPTNSQGRGKVRLPGSFDTTAPRVSFELHVRPLGPHEKVLQTCANPPCSNPRHLRAGTQRDVQRSSKLRRTA